MYGIPPLWEKWSLTLKGLSELGWIWDSSLHFNWRNATLSKWAMKINLGFFRLYRGWNPTQLCGDHSTESCVFFPCFISSFQQWLSGWSHIYGLSQYPHQTPGAQPGPRISQVVEAGCQLLYMLAFHADLRHPHLNDQQCDKLNVNQPWFSTIDSQQGSKWL